MNLDRLEEIADPEVTREWVESVLKQERSYAWWDVERLCRSWLAQDDNLTRWKQEEEDWKAYEAKLLRVVEAAKWMEAVSDSGHQTDELLQRRLGGLMGSSEREQIQRHLDFRAALRKLEEES